MTQHEGQLLNKLNKIIEHNEEATNTSADLLEKFITTYEELQTLKNTITSWRATFDQTGVLAGEFITASDVANIQNLLQNEIDEILVRLSTLTSSTAIVTFADLTALRNELQAEIDAIISGESTYSTVSDLTALQNTLQAEIDAINITLSTEQAHYPGTSEVWYGDTVPPGVLQIAATTINVSRTVYSRLYAQIGITFGAGDGSTTFGLPAIPSGWTTINGTPGTQTVGQILAHDHNFYQVAMAGGGDQATVGGGNGAWEPTSSTGGSYNGAAGIGANFGIYY